MKILMLEWDSFGQEYLTEEFNKVGCEVEIYKWPFGKEDMRENVNLRNVLIDKLQKCKTDFIFSFNFFPVAAEACYTVGVKYVSWIYDTPYLLLYSKHIRYETNLVFFFDQTLCREFQKNKICKAYYLPMAVPSTVYKNIENEVDNKYKADISFVGSTYRENKQDFFRLFDGISSYATGYLEGIMKMQKNIYGCYILEDVLIESIIKELKKVCPIPKGEDEWESDAWLYSEYFLARRLTGEQRTEILALVSEKYEVKLYTPEKTPELPYVNNCGPVDYITQMPQVFRNSKINLNMTLRSIRSGIPLRAMDIMGCGGFLLTNFQADFLNFFIPDEDFVYYTDNDDLLSKVEYYLVHDKEREEIAQNGYKKVMAGHTYAHRVQEILDILDNEK